ncbi:MAG: hypothetical protein JXR07_19250 [Reichenbachiella sp.]
MKFQDQIKAHLSRYKHSYFPESENGTWSRNKNVIPLTYAFTKKDKHLNLIQDYRHSFLESKFIFGKRPIKLHMYFNHLNSSQAMCINFFYPLIIEEKLDLIAEYLGFTNESIDYDSAEFEKDSEIDSQGGRRPTNFDFYFRTNSGKHFFFEIKYTENKFGPCSDDDEHRDKYAKVYVPNLGPIEANYREVKAFFKNYQIIRNLIHVGKDKYVVFLYPVKNKKIKEGAAKANNEILKKAYHSNFFDRHWKDIYQFVDDRITGRDLKKQLNSFKEKYFID